MLDPGKPSFTPKKGKPSVIMFVGLQGMWICLNIMFDLSVMLSFEQHGLLMIICTGHCELCM